MKKIIVCMSLILFGVMAVPVDALAKNEGCMPVACTTSRGNDRINAETLSSNVDGASSCYICEKGYCDEGAIVRTADFSAFKVCNRGNWAYDDHWDTYNPTYCKDKPDYDYIAGKDGVGLEKVWVADGVEYKAGQSSGNNTTSYATGQAICYYYKCIEGLEYDFDSGKCVSKGGVKPNPDPNPVVCPDGSSDKVLSSANCANSQVFECTKKENNQCVCGVCKDKPQSDGDEASSGLFDKKTICAGKDAGVIGHWNWAEKGFSADDIIGYTENCREAGGTVGSKTGVKNPNEQNSDKVGTLMQCVCDGNIAPVLPGQPGPMPGIAQTCDGMAQGTEISRVSCNDRDCIKFEEEEVLAWTGFCNVAGGQVVMNAETYYNPKSQLQLQVMVDVLTCVCPGKATKPDNPPAVTPGKCQRCHEHGDKAEMCNACCALPKEQTVWQPDSKTCFCVNGGKFVKENGEWDCKVETNVVPTQPTFNCDATLIARMNQWKKDCVGNSDIIDLIVAIEALCKAGSRTQAGFDNLWNTLLAYNPGQCKQEKGPKWDCPSVKMTQIAEWKIEFAGNSQIMSLITNIEAYCVSSVRVETQFNIDFAKLENAVNVERKTSAGFVRVKKSVDALDGLIGGFERNVWRDEDGEFNRARLASDMTAGVVLGTAGGLITSHVMKKKQVENGFEDIQCTIGGQTVAGWGDEFQVGIQ
ncbi:MAG: hypothetical protein J6S06_01255 [Alphaproteobacteria bacterium]|nr:hypothetical protein [Alphaproteobacteria bacterium]